MAVAGACFLPSCKRCITCGFSSRAPGRHTKEEETRSVRLYSLPEDISPTTCSSVRVAKCGHPCRTITRSKICSSSSGELSGVGHRVHEY